MPLSDEGMINWLWFDGSKWGSGLFAEVMFNLRFNWQTSYIHWKVYIPGTCFRHVLNDVWVYILSMPTRILSIFLSGTILKIIFDKR